MEPINNGIELTGTLFTSAQGDAKDKLAYAEQIWDDDLKKSQKEINANVGKLPAQSGTVIDGAEALFDTAAKNTFMLIGDRYTDTVSNNEVISGFKATGTGVNLQLCGAFPSYEVVDGVKQYGVDYSYLNLALPLVDNTHAGIISAADKKLIDSLPDSIASNNFAISERNNGIELYYSRYFKDEGEYIFDEYSETVTIPFASSTKAGVMSANDKSVLDTLKTVFNNTKSFIPDSLEATQYSDNIHFELTGKVFNDEGNYDSDGVQVTINAATSTSAGVMSANDKVALDKATTFESTFPQYITGLYWVRNLAVQEATDGIHLKIAEYQHFNNKLVVTSTDGYINLPFASSTNGGFMTSTDKSNLDNVVAELPNKANISDIPDIEVKRILDDDTFENVDSVTREDVKKDLFIDIWNNVCGVWGKYNESTGYFELNGLTDITYEEALNIYNAGWINGEDSRGLYDIPGNKMIRTNIPSQSLYLNDTGYSAYGIKIGHSDFHGVTDVLNLTSKFGTSSDIFYISRHNDSNTNGYPFNPEIKKIIGTIDIFGNALQSEWFRLSSLTDFHIVAHFDATRNKFRLIQWVNPSIDSINFLINNAKDVPTNGAVIAVNSNVYAKLTDTTNTEWNALLTAAAAKNITFATA